MPFEVPRGPELAPRLASVLEVIYLVFNEGYSASAGDDWLRPQLCEDALRLGRILAGLAPEEPEVHGLVALMELHASRLRARLGPSGEPILLLDQNRARWDPLLIRRGLSALARAEALSETRARFSGAFKLIQSRRVERSTWPPAMSPPSGRIVIHRRSSRRRKKDRQGLRTREWRARLTARCAGTFPPADPAVDPIPPPATSEARPG